MGQQPPPLPDAPKPTQTQPPEQNDRQNEPSKNHILWVIPNYRSDENPATIKPLTPGAKMRVAFHDSFDPSAFLVAGVFARVAMAQRQYTSFGQAAQGFGKYYGGAFADQAIGNLMSDGLFPLALHQDPRYFVRGQGGFWKRTGYALSWNSSPAATMAAITSTLPNWLEMPQPQVSPTSTTRLPTGRWRTQQTSGDNKSPWVPSSMWQKSSGRTCPINCSDGKTGRMAPRTDDSASQFRARLPAILQVKTGWRMIAGSESVMTAPPAGRSEICTAPPCAFTTASTKARPSPWPGD